MQHWHEMAAAMSAWLNGKKAAGIANEAKEDAAD